jgi:hypothetical protein
MTVERPCVASLLLVHGMEIDSAGQQNGGTPALPGKKSAGRGLPPR